MKEHFEYNEHTEPRKPQTLKRLFYKLFAPTIAFGFIALSVFMAWGPDSGSTESSTFPDFAVQNAERVSYFQTNSEQDAPENLHAVKSFIDTLEPQIESMQEKITELQGANDTTWKQDRTELVRVWEKLDATFEELSESLSNS